MVMQTVRLPEEVAARLDRLARETRRSKSSFIIEAVERYLEERDDL
jgi:predicted DNA-binding protein